MVLDALELAQAAMRFDGAAFRSVLDQPAVARQAWLVLLLAALMLAATQSVVLLANRVPPVRFLLSLLLEGLRQSVTALGFGAAFIIAGRLLGVAEAGAFSVLALVALAWAPGLLALFSVVPHFGLGWQRIIDAWIAALMVAGLAFGLGLALPAAAAVGVTGWLVGRLSSLAIGPLLGRINWRLLEAVAGRALVRDADPLAVLRAQAADPATVRALP